VIHLATGPIEGSPLDLYFRKVWQEINDEATAAVIDLFLHGYVDSTKHPDAAAAYERMLRQDTQEVHDRIVARMTPDSPPVPSVPHHPEQP
jgi:hypothetical protein